MANLDLGRCALDTEGDELDRRFYDWFVSNDPSLQPQVVKSLLITGFLSVELWRKHFNSQKYNRVEEDDERLTCILRENLRLVEQAETAKSMLDQERTEAPSRVRAELEREHGLRMQAKEARHAQAMAEKDALHSRGLLDSQTQFVSLRVESARNLTLYDDARSRINEILSGDMARELEALRKRLQETEGALSVARRSNFGRGAIGEHRVASFLRNAFPTFTVCDTSKDPHSCDLWMKTENNNEFFAFESKNKETIVARGDLDKFYGDISRLAEKHGDNFMGGVFVSCRTSNIPGKGALHVEVFEDRPVLFAGFNDEDGGGGDFMWLRDILSMFMSIASHLKKLRTNRTTDDSDGGKLFIQEKLAPMLDRVNRVRSCVERMRSVHLAASIDLAMQAGEELRSLFTDIMAVCGVLPQQPDVSGSTNTTASGSTTNNNGVQCERCGRWFKARRGIVMHERKCANGGKKNTL